MLIDRARIYVKAGNGGNGAMSFRREKFVPRGGPDGGDGGRGGDVVLRVRPNLSSLIAFQFNQHFNAQNGQGGAGQQKHGRSGATLFVDVPPGTVVWDDETGDLLGDLTEADTTIRVARGGQGGLGNSHFKTSTRQAPRIAELGEPGEEHWLRMELRLIADVGLVGLPNAGKSTLLAAASRARPKIADYPFTTLEPNLGVVQVGGKGGQAFVLADVPGLIEGAAGGAGLGHEFLRHVTRTKALIHVLDASGGLEGRDPLVDFQIIFDELRAFDPTMVKKPTLVALNKIDLPEAREQLARLRRDLDAKGYRVFEVSAATGHGVADLMNTMAVVLQELHEREAVEPREQTERKVYRLETVDERVWTVTRLSPDHFKVVGGAIERLTRKTNWDQEDAIDRFQRVLKSSGIADELTRQGVNAGDTVEVAGHELTWGEPHEYEEQRPKRRTAQQRRFGVGTDE